MHYTGDTFFHFFLFGAIFQFLSEGEDFWFLSLVKAYKILVGETKYFSKANYVLNNYMEGSGSARVK